LDLHTKILRGKGSPSLSDLNTICNFDVVVPSVFCFRRKKFGPMTLEVKHEPSKQRFVITLDGGAVGLFRSDATGEAVLCYEPVREGVWDMWHTEVPGAVTSAF
jgi:hypothetical protein